jgi:hypothetical protein
MNLIMAQFMMETGKTINYMERGFIQMHLDNPGKESL